MGDAEEALMNNYHFTEHDRQTLSPLVGRAFWLGVLAGLMASILLWLVTLSLGGFVLWLMQ